MRNDRQEVDPVQADMPNSAATSPSAGDITGQIPILGCHASGLYVTPVHMDKRGTNHSPVHSEPLQPSILGCNLHATVKEVHLSGHLRWAFS